MSMATLGCLRSSPSKVEDLGAASQARGYRSLEPHR